MDQSWKRRLQGRALEHGLVFVVCGSKAEKIRMADSDGNFSEYDAPEILSAMRFIAVKLCKSMSAKLEPLHLRDELFERQKAYADQHVRRVGQMHTDKSIDLRINVGKIGDAAEWLWIEVKWGSLEYWRTQRAVELKRLRDIATDGAQWELVKPPPKNAPAGTAGAAQPLEVPKAVAFLIVHPTSDGFGWELYVDGLGDDSGNCRGGSTASYADTVVASLLEGASAPALP